jgi:predicted metal-binding membrane protein
MVGAVRMVAGPREWLERNGRPPTAVLAVGALAAVAWVVLAVDLASMPGMASAATPGFSSAPPWICSPAGSAGMAASGGAGGAAGRALAGLPMWSLMAPAMMLPAALPATSHVATNSLRRRRGRAVSEFLAAYLALWLGFGAPVLLLLALLPLDRAADLVAAGLAVAALWELSPAKRWALNRCHRTSPLPPNGWRASLGTARFGLLHGGACVASCWPLMLVMAVAPSARLAWCAALAGLGLAEKLTFKPRRSARRVGLLFALAAALAGLAVPIGV